MSPELLKIKEIIEELLRIMDFPGEVQIDSQSDGFWRVNIQSPEAAYLIGHNGDNLKALQQISRAIVSRRLGETANFVLDVNDYQSSRLERIKEMAADLAREVINHQQPRELAPMNAYERRIVHMALANLADVKTESTGEGETRRVVIRPT